MVADLDLTEKNLQNETNEIVTLGCKAQKAEREREREG